VSVVANVAVNLDARGVTSQLAAIRQGSIGAADGFKNLQARAQAVKSIVEAQQGSFAKASTVQGVFAAKVKNTEFAIKAQIAALRDVQSKVQFSGALYQKAGQQIKQYEAVLRSANKEEEKGIGIKGRLQGALISIGAGALVAGMVRGAAAAEQLQLRLKLLSREYGETERVQQFVAQSAKTFGQSQIEASAGVADVYARLRPLGTSLAQIETVYKGFNAVALASGTSAEAASGAFLQLSQALGSGRLQGDEFRSVAEQVPGILKLVADEMGVTVGQLKQLGSDGKITSDILINALAKGFEENKDKIAELLALSPAQRFKEFKDSTQALSNAIGSELLPAIVPVVKVATELLRLFGQLPGPMKTIIAAAIGLTAAFVALAPAISTAISLLGGLSLATLAAAGPWIALAAGVTAAAVALAGYRSESEKIGAKAAAGDPAALAAARNRIASKQQEVSLLAGQRPGPRSSRGGDLANAQRELAQLKRDVATGTTAPSIVRPNAVGTPVGATVGGGGGGGGGRAAGGGAGKAANDAKRAADEAERAAEAAAQEAARVQEVIRNRLAEGQIIAVKIQQQDRIAAAEAAGDKMLVARLQSQERELEIQYRYAQELAKEVNLDAQKAIIYEGQNALTANQLDLQRELDVLQTQSDQDRLTSLQKAIEKQYELNTAVQNQLQFADGVANTLGQGLGSAFDALISGAQEWEKSLQQIASGVLIDIANQLIRIFVIEQAINAIKTLLTPFSAATPLGAGGGTVGKFGTLGPNYGIPQRAKGGPVSSGQTYMVGERGPELFVPGRSGTIIANDKMGGGSTNVVVNVDAKGSSVEGDEQGANQLGRVISAAVQSELIKQQRPGGILAR
jgi:tape measure domain-containing protein